MQFLLASAQFLLIGYGVLLTASTVANFALGLTDLWRSTAKAVPATAPTPEAIEPVAAPAADPLAEITIADCEEVAAGLTALIEQIESQVSEQGAAFSAEEKRSANIKKALWSRMSPEALRKECARHGVRWRNGRPDGKHLRKAEMVEALLKAA